MFVLLSIDYECHYTDRELYNLNTVNWEPGEPYVQDRKQCEFVPRTQFTESYDDVAIPSIHTELSSRKSLSSILSPGLDK